MTDSALETAFAHYWRVLAPGAPEPEREFYFAKPRQWRFDFAWPSRFVAVECEGGVWNGGRHVRGNGFTHDCEKYSLAALLGWTVVRLTAEMLYDDPARWIEAILAAVTSGASCEEVGG